MSPERDDKEELLMMRREKDKLERTLGGIRDMAKIPSAIWVVDTKKNIAVGDSQTRTGHCCSRYQLRS